MLGFPGLATLAGLIALIGLTGLKCLTGLAGLKCLTGLAGLASFTGISIYSGHILWTHAFKLKNYFFMLHFIIRVVEWDKI